MKKPELLAPAGGKAQLTAAVNSGADAVYMGGLAFNARIFADNFRDEELKEAIDFAHLHDVKVYITLNILLKDSELVRAFEYANYLYSIGADALIVQDMGLARLVRRYLPDFPLHLSTQATLYNRQGLGMAGELGFTRVVPARELSLKEIEELSGEAAELGMTTEIFVHGALCMCYSGQCQMSRINGAGGKAAEGNSGSCRSGNRGTCAQPCRQLYTDDKGRSYYALSPKDNCQIGNIPELVLSGASSFKIEGRMKTPEYVAVVTGIYRKYIDRFCELLEKYGREEALAGYSVADEDILTLKQVFNRGSFTEGYIHGNPGENILSGVSPKNQGICAGTTVAVLDSAHKAQGEDERLAVRGALRRGKVLACIRLDREAAGFMIEKGDGIEFRDVEEWNIAREAVGGVTTFVKYLDSEHVIVGDFDRGLEVGDRVFKVTDRRLAEKALSLPEKKLPVTMLFTAREGLYPSLVMTDIRAGRSIEITADHIVERARKVATEVSRVEDCLLRLGDTPFEATGVMTDIQIDEDVMIPVSLINRMRREAVESLMQSRLEAASEGRRPLEREALKNIEADERLGEVCLDVKALEDRLLRESFEPVPIEIWLEKYRSGEVDSASGELPYILNISKGRLDRMIEDNFGELAAALVETGVLIGNPGWIREFREAGVRVYGDYGLNVYNEQARLAYAEAGVDVLLPSHETGMHDRRGIPLMITEHSVPSSTLKDRKGRIHRICTAPSGDKTLIY